MDVGNRRETDRSNSRRTYPSTYDVRYRVPTEWGPATPVDSHLPVEFFSAWTEEPENQKNQGGGEADTRKKKKGKSRENDGGRVTACSCPIRDSYQRKSGWNKRTYSLIPMR